MNTLHSLCFGRARMPTGEHCHGKAAETKARGAKELSACDIDEVFAQWVHESFSERVEPRLVA
jgi:hypothetical protein